MVGGARGQHPRGVDSGAVSRAAGDLHGNRRPRGLAFDRAAARWQLAIYGDVADITLDIPAGSCLGNEPPIDRPIDDLFIFVTLDSIDGPSGIIGGATPCFIRLAGKLPLVGAMVFDTADVAMLMQSGRWDEVVLHEIGHVLGFGALWHQNVFNLIVGEGGADPHFVGGRGRAAFDRMGGTGYTAGAKVPLENTGASGTRDVHWRESALGVELMTGYLNMANVNPLSVATLASLEDEGYLVNYAAADALALAFVPAVRGPAQPAGVRLVLQDDVLRVPIREVDGAGRVTGIYRP